MGSQQVDKQNDNTVMSPEDVAEFLKKSVSWVYKNRQELGGVKVKGSVFFPAKELIYDRIFQTREGIPVRHNGKETTVQQQLVPNQKGGKTGRSRTKGRAKESGSGVTDRFGDPNRHNLL